MNCKVESMKENCKNHHDTLPPRGRVNEVRREWLVHEDGALAYRLQNEEIKQHLIGNKSRNIQIREDFPRAKDEQQKEAEEAIRLHQELLLQQEKQDAEIAIQLADRIQREEEERRKMLEEDDKELAKLLQEQEHMKMAKRDRDLRELETHTPKKDKYFLCEDKRNQSRQRPMPQYLENHSTSQNSYYYDDNLSGINTVGLPLYNDIVQPLRNFTLNDRSSYKSVDENSQYFSEDEAKRIQEEKDEEYARYLQERENYDNIDSVNRDRLLAIETQDKELARLLQEKERAKARRARERAKQRAAMKRMQEGEISEGAALDRENVTIKMAETVPVNCQRNSDGEFSGHKDVPSTSSSFHSSGGIPGPQSDTSSKIVKSKPRYPDPEEIVSLPLEGGSSTLHSNIAATIDPTYARESLEKNSKVKKSSNKGTAHKNSGEVTLARMSREDLVIDGSPPPYMPIQGQRRLSEKKPKQKDNCKQQ